jgi:hypothetical protein
MLSDVADAVTQKAAGDRYLSKTFLGEELAAAAPVKVENVGCIAD